MTIQLLTPIDFLANCPVILTVEQTEAFIDDQPDTLFPLTYLDESLEMVLIAI